MLSVLTRVSLSALAVFATLGAQSTPPTQEDLAKKLSEALQGSWLASAPWGLDFDEAKKRAKATGKPIFAYFTRSYTP